MEIEFIFDSDYFSTDGVCNQITVSFLVEGNSTEGYTPGTFDIFDQTSNCVRDLKDFPKEEQALIEGIAQDLLNDVDVQDLIDSDVNYSKEDQYDV